MWIDVKERLPEEEHQYNYHVWARINEGTKYETEGVVSLRWAGQDYGFVDEITGNNNRDVTYWYDFSLVDYPGEEQANLNKLAAKIFTANQRKGFWGELPEQRNFGEILMLITSELVEALEADRCNDRASSYLLDDPALINGSDDTVFWRVFESNIKDTVEDEMADALIRILDYCGAMNIDIENHIEMKLRYNAMREHKHGKKY